MTKEIEESHSRTQVSTSPTENLRFDAPAGLVVFLIALPLCLGIAFASRPQGMEVPPIMAGLVAGIVGGLVVAPLSKSSLAVSGPAAGLVTIVIGAITDLGYEGFLMAVVLAGAIQVLLGFLRAGIIAYYFPISVIKGMLAGIGAVLVLKQLPHAMGYDGDYEGDDAFWQPDGKNTLTEIYYAILEPHLGAALITVICLAVLILWARSPRLTKIRFLPAPFVVVVLGVVINAVYDAFIPALSVDQHLLVGIPVAADISQFFEQFKRPDFGRILDPLVWQSAAVIAVVASVETLLCVEAVDKLDPFKRVTPKSHELKAQGAGNLVAGLLGGLPLTAVIVRGSANVQSGARTKTSAFIHGALLLLAVVGIPSLLNLIPLAALAAILLNIGYKLASIPLFKKMWAEGKTQFYPFLITFAGILLTDLLKGIAVGLAVGLFFVLKQHVSAPYAVHELATFDDHGHEHTRVEFADNVSFLNKASVVKILAGFPRGAIVELDARRSQHIDHDILEEINEFRETAGHRDIEVICHGLDEFGSTGDRSNA